MKKTSENLEKMRHSMAHLLAMAVRALYPEVKVGMGPAIENGFYYDFDFGEIKISEDDLKKIEQKMYEVVKKGFEFKKEIVKISKAKEIFKEDFYKLEMLADLEKAGNTKASIYKSGEFQDLCKGPHLESSRDFGAFRLTKLAGSYWKGNEKNKMLTRIYGIGFATEKELRQYLTLMEEAEKRDHRKLGKELDLFLIDPVAGLGLVLWQQKGAILWRVIEDFWYQKHLKNGYQLVRTPHIGSRKLWKTSGHWGFYNESMYPPLEVGRSLEEVQKGEKKEVKEEYLLKPMNCPLQILLYKAKPHSYRDLPIRWAECGTVYRYEKSGELSGLTRARGFTQDDAHIICTKEQVEEELKKVVDFILFIYKSFGFDLKDVNVYLSVRDPEVNKYAGDDDGWKFTEETLEKIAKEKKLNYQKDIGSAVFYGPKLDFKIKDVLGREWQCSTLQFDFNLPERFDMTYVNCQGEKERPYMLHRALFGSFERFIGLLIEHYAGAFPVWLAPVQAVIVPVSEKFTNYAKKVQEELKQADVRVEVNSDDETLGKRIRESEKQKIPFILVVGEKEEKEMTVAVRSRENKKPQTVKIGDFVKEFLDKLCERE